MKILNISFPRVEIEPTYNVYSETLVPLRHNWPQLYHITDIFVVSYNIKILFHHRKYFNNKKARTKATLHHTRKRCTVMTQYGAQI